jgi:tetratricopeptide (TPR) repeat protein
MRWPIQALLQKEVGVSDGVELFSKSIALKKDLLFTRLFRMESFDPRSADQDTQMALQLAPTNPRAMVNRGIYYCGMHEFDKAQAMFDRARNPTGPWARIYFNEGRLASSQGDYDHCVARYKLARELEPDSQIIYLQAVEALLESHRPSEALAWLDDAAKEGIDSHEIRSLRCRAYQADGNYFGVIAERLKDPENSLPLFILITSLVLLGHLALIPVSSLAASKW